MKAYPFFSPHYLFYSLRNPLHNQALSPFQQTPLGNRPAPHRFRLAEHFRWPCLVAFMGVLWAGCATGESLWLDELHTSWSVSGTWSEVATRARQGNQSPLYFYGLFGLVRTLGNLEWMSGELLLRLPSVVCWAFTLLVCLRITAQQWADSPPDLTSSREPQLRGRLWSWGQSLNRRLLGEDPRPAMGVAMVLWLVLDRIQLFYATEARVYAGVQLVSLLAWYCIARLAASDAPRAVDRTIIWWCGLSVLLISLHITAALACVWQIACGTWILYKCRSRVGLPQTHGLWAAAVAIVLSTLGVAWMLSSEVWEHRQQWASFAGDASWNALIGLFPLAAYAVPVAAARGVDWLCSLGLCVRSRRTRSTHRELEHRELAHGPLDTTDQYLSSTAQWLWWVAVAGPWLSAWWITSLGIAPVFHRRFVIVVAVPLLLVAATELARIRRPALRWSAVLGVAAWLVISQGTLGNWRSGAWYGWQRLEGWRQASQFLQSQVQSGETVWCYSGLIEESGAELPLTDSLNQYLSFPLRGLYQVVDSQGEPCAPRALVGNGASWHGQMLSAGGRENSPAHADPDGETGGEAEETVSHQVAGERFVTGQQWIVYRGGPASFERHLRLLQRASAQDSLESWQIDSPQSFGLVSVVRISREKRE